ncbi:hypothetical protein PHLCEN_2v10762 [Hermanssonia centrifuga]|uniref:Uncharacterized protein n=1 Tax=Hermanssonia centrifuga TaxID=98765 RepID=A0A2R6NN39_9APHY|nr:hypothetical protein PHLCEN_2v10762 [Hermanssonia centrifuga]
MSKTDPIFIPRNTADSEACPPSTSRRRPQQLELFSTEDVENPLPSPPYRRVASQTYLHPYPEESPAYNSQSRLDLSTELSRMVEENEDQHPPSDKESEHIVDLDEHKPSAKTARFREDVQSPLATIHPLPSFVRAETFESTRSRSPSIADTDDERDDYDWSGEEDLVDEEAKFEQNMGVAKKESWGFRKYVWWKLCAVSESSMPSNGLGLSVLPMLIVFM